MKNDTYPNIEIGYGVATGDSSFSAGVEAVKKAISSISRHAISALLIYTSAKHNLDDVLRGVHSVARDVPLFGTTTAGEICNGVHKGSVVISALASPFLSINCAIGTDVSKNWERALDEAISSPNIHPYFHADGEFSQEITRKGKNIFIMLFSPGNTRKNNSKSFEILEALKIKSLGRFPIVGGSSADDWRLETNYILHGQKAYPDSLLLAVFETELKFGISMTHGFLPASRRSTVTSVDGHEVLTLDGLPACKRMSELIGSSDSELEGKHISLTMGVVLGTFDPMKQYSINVASYFTHRGGLLLTQPVSVGTVLTVMEPDTESMVSAGSDALRKAIIRGGINDISLCLVNYCALRPRMIGKKSDDEIAGMITFLDGKPLVGFSSFGEQGVGDDGVSRHNNAAVSCLILGNELSDTANVAHRNAELLNTLQAEIDMRRGAEQALRESNELFAQLMLHSPIFVYIKEVTPSESRVLYASENFSQMIGIAGSHMVGKAMTELFPSEFAAKITSDDWAVVSRGELLKLNEELNGRSYTTIKFPLVQGQRTLLAGYTIDITEQKRLEEQSLRAQKLESIGTLAGGIAHDFNNLLQGIFGYISMAKISSGQPEKSRAMLEQAEKALHQSVNLTSQLLTFSKGGKPMKKLIDLRPVIENAANFTLSGSRCDFRLDIPENMWRVEADEGQLGQVIQNIVLNADQAMPVGGTVIVTAANVAEAEASLPPGLAKGQYVMIAIQDTGIGIPERFLGNIFDPYFTTKEKGSGLGLATSYSIVSNHGGVIDVRTKSGQGSTFLIYLPARAGQTSGDATFEPEKRSLTRTARILVMDDEEIIRNLSSELLRVLGHEVEVSKHGQEALEMYQSAVAGGKPFDIVILDLTVRGGMGGSETMQNLLAIDPAVRAIASSGYSEDTRTVNYQKQGFKAFLKKPYHIDTLSEVLNKMLNS